MKYFAFILMVVLTQASFALPTEKPILRYNYLTIKLADIFIGDNHDFGDGKILVTMEFVGGEAKEKTVLGVFEKINDNNHLPIKSHTVFNTKRVIDEDIEVNIEIWELDGKNDKLPELLQNISGLSASYTSPQALGIIATVLDVYSELNKDDLLLKYQAQLRVARTESEYSELTSQGVDMLSVGEFEAKTINVPPKKASIAKLIISKAANPTLENRPFYPLYKEIHKSFYKRRPNEAVIESNINSIIDSIFDDTVISYADQQSQLTYLEMLRTTQLYLKLEVSSQAAKVDNLKYLENMILTVLEKQQEDEKTIGIVLEQVLNLEQLGNYKNYTNQVLSYLKRKSSFNKQYKPSPKLGRYFSKYQIQ